METTQQQVIDLAITHETHGFCYANANTDAGYEWVSENVQCATPHYFGIDDVRYAEELTVGAIEAGLIVIVNGNLVTVADDGETVIIVQ